MLASLVVSHTTQGGQLLYTIWVCAHLYSIPLPAKTNQYLADTNNISAHWCHTNSHTYIIITGHTTHLPHNHHTYHNCSNNRYTNCASKLHLFTSLFRKALIIQPKLRCPNLQNLHYLCLDLPIEITIGILNSTNNCIFRNTLYGIYTFKVKSY